MNFIKTEYSFKKVFYPLEEAVDDSINLGHEDICIIDNTTYGYVKFEKLCKEKGSNPIFGLSVFVTDEKIKSRSYFETYKDGEEVILIAINQEGVKDLYRIFSLSTEKKYYFNRVYPDDINSVNIIVISDKFNGNFKKDWMCIPDTRYPHIKDIPTYQCITGSRGIPTKQHFMMSDYQLRAYYTQDQIDRKNNLSNIIHPYELPKSGMIKYNGKLNFTNECYKGILNLGLECDDEYMNRLNYEIKMINEKGYSDYFMIVSQMIKTAKKDMIVGPGRGSSGGSLVCYCLGITNIDPIKFGLIFERFIDTNRDDLPDIDTDYPDNKRQDVINQLKSDYKSAYSLGTIYTYQPRTVINDFAKCYELEDIHEVKNAIIERSSGDARAKACLADTFSGTEIGKEFINKYPFMMATTRAESHARHSGKHAAGIIVTDKPMTDYASVNIDDDLVCLEGHDAEAIGLLKIDCLGLRTLSVIENCLRLSGVPIEEIYDIDIENKEVLNVFNTSDMSDIFQFDGDAIRMVNSKINVTKFSDLAAITALGRPGALNSGGTNRYIKIDNGEREPDCFGEIYENVTKETHGIVIYQEQTMVLLREYGSLSWGDINTMRKIISKSRGDEFFARYKEKFIKGAIENMHKESDANIVWDAIASMGSYAFNKSHAVAYAMISYWCAYCKLNYPLNFLAANLNNVKDSDHGLRMLRQYVKVHNIEYIPVDSDLSGVGWIIHDGMLIGGLTNIKGIGEKKALDIIKRRDKGLGFTPAIYIKLMNPITDYDVLYPMAVNYKHIYEGYNITKIEELYPDEVPRTTIGKLISKDLRDRNDLQSVLKRGGKKVTENTHYLNLIIQDDTGTIKCTLAPFKMDALDGLGLSESLVINSVIAIKGIVRKGWQTLSIEEIINIENI